MVGLGVGKAHLLPTQKICKTVQGPQHLDPGHIYLGSFQIGLEPLQSTRLQSGLGDPCTALVSEHFGDQQAFNPQASDWP